MAEVTIHLTTDPITRKRTILVNLESDPDSLPHEHEQQHRALVQQLVSQGVISIEEIDHVIIDRGVTPEQTDDLPQSEPAAQPEAQQSLS